MSVKVLIVEDEQDIGRSVAYAFEREGFEARAVADGRSALETAGAWEPDVVLLDLILPDMDGLDVCRELQRTSDVAVIMVSARTEEVDRIVGLEVGADDYVCKPFSVRELIARVRAVLRRGGERTTKPTSSPPPLVSGNLEMDLRSRRVMLDGEPVTLTRKEFALLQVLMEHPGEAMTRQELHLAVWGEQLPSESRTLDTHVYSLREKIGDNPSSARRIVTVRGVGYRFEG